MNKIYLLTAAFAVMASLSGCSDTELASIETAQEKTPIGFHTVGSQMGSRATIINSSDDLKGHSFNVYAFTRNNEGNDDALFMGNNDADPGCGGVNISYKDNKWDYTDASNLKYWPTGSLNFYAVSLVSEYPTYSWQITKDKKEIGVITHNEYEDPANNSEYVDVMYAITKNKNQSSNGGTVKMQFRHILSQVAFKARTDIPNMEVTIEGIKIFNFYSIGIFTLPATDAKPTQDNWKWSDLGYSKTGFTAVKDKNIKVENTATSISDGPMLFIPQKLEKWATTAASPMSTAQATTAKQSYLEINCRIKLDGSYRVGTEGTFNKLYVPFGADWQPGKSYIYTLVFGGGYKVDGTPILQSINFETDVEGWNEDAGNKTTGNDIPLYQQQ